jgi:outer membrane protein OmpA-like peptidoglycan-associated protein
MWMDLFRDIGKRRAMLIRAPGAVLAVAVLALAPAAWAGPDYTAQQIIERFTVKPAGQPVAGTRSVYLGASGYGPTTAAAEDPRFNLMITFDFNSDRLTGNARRNLDEFIGAVNDPALQNLRFLIAGHTDSSGSDAYNLALSQRRADAVVTYLVDKGVAPGRLVAKGFGESDPLDGRPDDPANRRVEARMAE